jgi:hypothetical protein
VLVSIVRSEYGTIAYEDCKGYVISSTVLETCCVLESGSCRRGDEAKVRRRENFQVSEIYKPASISCALKEITELFNS